MDDESLEPLGGRGFFRSHFPTLPRLFKYLLLLVCAIALLVVTAAVAFNIYGSAQLRDARVHAAEAMVPLTRQGFRTKYIPVQDTENAALYYEAAFGLMRADGRDEITDVTGAAEWPSHPSDLPLPADYIERMRAVVAGRKTLLDVLREARRFEKADYNTDFDEPACLLPHLSTARTSARLLAMAMYVAAADGRTDDGISHARDCLAISRSLSREPLLKQALVSMAISSIVCGTPLSAVLASGDASDADLAGLQEELFDYAEGFSMRPALEGDLVMANGIFEEIRSGRMRTGEVFDSRSQRLNLPGWLVAGYLKTDQANAIEIFLSILRETEMPPAEVTARWEERNMALSESPWVLSRMLVPALGGAVTQAERARTRMLATGLAVAALRSKNQTGRWPETPGELTGDFIDRLPSDPVTGDPFVFAVLDDGLIIYSVGENGFDDGGKPYLVPTPKSERYKYDDVGFRIPFVRPERTSDAAE